VTVVVLPRSGPPGTEVSVDAWGLPADREVEVAVGQEGSEHEAIQTLVTDENGEIEIDLTIPMTAFPDESWTVVVGAPDGQPRGVSTVFRVLRPGADPAVETAQDTIYPGERVGVTVRDFPAEAAIDLGMGRPNSEYDIIAGAMTNAKGAATTTLTVPDFVEPADEWVFVAVTADGAGQAVSDVLQATRVEAATARIYLIALEDGGESGEEVGCGDSIVPAEVEIDPQSVGLAAVMEHLLGLHSREHPTTGLYNALYQSDLTVEEVNVANGKATVHQSGQLRVGGACDVPRIEAQLRQTALQFPEVDQVSVPVNGESIEELLAAN
jgi:hypothetical protein